MASTVASMREVLLIANISLRGVVQQEAIQYKAHRVVYRPSSLMRRQANDA